MSIDNFIFHFFFVYQQYLFFIEMNRSFLCGILVASSTWCISIYLYWMLVHSSTDSVALGTRNLLEASNPLVENSKDNEIIQAKKDFLLKKYENEKKLRKISQKLMDELRPINVDTGDGTLLIGIDKNKLIESEVCLHVFLNSNQF